jgi:REP-associated tyrosine transposase
MQQSMHLQRKYCYRRTLPHLLKDNRPIFVTFTTNRRCHLPPEARRIILECCLQEHQHSIDLHAAVIMPDHAHLIFAPLRDSEGWLFCLPEIMRLIKGRSAHRVNQLLGRTGPLWQDEFFDHVLRGNESLAQKVEYVCENPVRARLARTADAYPWLWKGTIPVL